MHLHQHAPSLNNRKTDRKINRAFLSRSRRSQRSRPTRGAPPSGSAALCSCVHAIGCGCCVKPARFGPIWRQCGAREAGAASCAPRYAMSGTGWYVRGMTAFCGQSRACAGGPRSGASGAQRPRGSRVRPAPCTSGTPEDRLHRLCESAAPKRLSPARRIRSPVRPVPQT